ncbi:MAG: MbnP family protein [Bacteroidota bacterium]
MNFRFSISIDNVIGHPGILFTRLLSVFYNNQVFNDHKMFAGLFAILISLLSLQKQPVQIQRNGKVELRFSHFVGDQKLNIDSTYKNAFGETYTISRFKYYVTNIKLVKSSDDSEIEIKDSYFLVYDDDDLSKTISLSVPEGNYSAISFLLGVDSLHNVSGAQTDALDPMNGMFWTWNTGYVIVKLEGRSSVSTLPGNLIEYHLGGFKGPDKVNRRISLPFPEGNMYVNDKKTLVLNVKADINLFFSGINKLPIKANPACTSAGSLARQYAENYATLFSISSAEVQ